MSCVVRRALERGVADGVEPLGDEAADPAAHREARRAGGREPAVELGGVRVGGELRGLPRALALACGPGLRAGVAGGVWAGAPSQWPRCSRARAIAACQCGRSGLRSIAAS